MRKTLCGLGLALALLGAGCAPADPAASPTPNATSASTEVLPRDVASVSLVDDVTVRDTQDAVELTMPDQVTPADLMADQVAATDQTDRSAETDLARKVMEGHRAELELAELALDQSDSREVQEAARMIQKDHGLAQAELRDSVLVELSDQVQLTKEHRALKEKLAKLEGQAFDKAYIKAMVKEHDKTLKMYREQARSAPTEALRSYFAEHAPVIEKHLKHCKSLQGSLS